MLVCIVVECPAPATKNKKKPPVRVVFLLLNCSTGFEPAKHKRKTDESMAVSQADKHNGTTER